jgi:AcrR family transcriptional regulator
MALPQRIRAQAAESFVGTGYQAASLESLAEAVGCPLDQITAHYPSKTAVAIALLDHLAGETAAALPALPSGTIAARYHAALTAKLAQLEPYRATVAAVFSAALDADGPSDTHQSGQALIGGTAAQAALRAAFEGLVNTATDAPRLPAQSAELAQLLYAGHLLVILFWLYDRSAERTATRQLIDLVRDGMALARPALVLPPVAKALTRLTATFAAGFGVGQPAS